MVEIKSESKEELKNTLLKSILAKSEIDKHDLLYVKGIHIESSYKEDKEDKDEFKWNDKSIAPQVKVTFDKIREEKIRAENDIYEAVKKFEWKTGIKIIKLDYETSRDKFNPRIKAVLERI